MSDSSALTSAQELGVSERPSVAVVIPCWNAEKWIARAIQSVLDQDYPTVEVIVIDDGSTDGSLDIIKSFARRIFWESGPNRGACAARNKGLAAANSEYILFLDADDWIEGEILRGMAAAALSENLDIIFAASRSEREGKIEEIYGLPVGANAKQILECYIAGRYTQTGAVLWRTCFLRVIGGWNILTLRHQDIELVLRALVAGGARARAIGAGFVNWRQHDGPRIHSRVGEAPIQAEMSFYDALLPYIGEFDQPMRKALGKRYYLLAAEAYYCRAYLCGRHALARARRLGFAEHSGSGLEKLIASVVGLRGFQALRRGRWALATSRLGPVLRKLRAGNLWVTHRLGSRA